MNKTNTHSRNFGQPQLGDGIFFGDSKLDSVTQIALSLFLSSFFHIFVHIFYFGRSTSYIGLDSRNRMG